MDEHEGKTTERVRGTTRKLDERAVQLRRTMTAAEQRLWRVLQSQRGYGLKFRRQHPVGRFVLDFYCAAAQLAVELDGDVHDQQVEEDRARTEQLERYNIRVLRFRNEDVMNDLPSVLARIKTAASNTTAPHD